MTENMMHPRPVKERWSFVDLALFASVVLLLVPNFNGSLHWAHENGGWPLKPRDFNLGMGLVVLALTLAARPSFSLAAVALLTLPLVRLLDAAFLQRWVNIEFGHSVFVLMVAGFFMTSVVAVLSLSAAKSRQIAIWVAMLTIASNSLANIYEYLGFAKFTRIEGRMAGWHVDPNHGPIIMCLMFGILFTIHSRYWWNMALAGLGGAGIALTMSRSGMAVFAFMTLLYVLAHFRQRLFGMIVVASIAIPLLAVGIGILGAASSRQGISKNEDTSSRWQAIFEGDFEKLKSPERAKDLLDGWDAVMEKPLLGHGTGAGGDRWQPHNMFVTQWIDLGLPGILHYAGILVFVTAACAMRRFRGIYCLIPAWLFIPCSQLLMDVSAYWYSLALAVMVIFPKRYAFALSRHPEPAAMPSTNAHA